MATPFTEIFQLFLNRDENFDSLNRMAKNLRYSKLSSFLFSSRSRFRNVAYANNGFDTNKMEDVVEFVQETYSFTFTGSSFTQVLDPAPPDNSLFYIELNNVKWSDYTFDSNNNTLTINNAPNQSNFLYVGAYVNGQFNQTLNIEEKDILADGMQINYLQSKINKEKLNNHTIHGKDYGFSGTQANHIRAQESRLKQIKSDFLTRIEGQYSYQQNPDDLENLGG